MKMNREHWLILFWLLLGLLLLLFVSPGDVYIPYAEY